MERWRRQRGPGWLALLGLLGALFGSPASACGAPEGAGAPPPACGETCCCAPAAAGPGLAAPGAECGCAVEAPPVPTATPDTLRAAPGAALPAWPARILVPAVAAVLAAGEGPALPPRAGERSLPPGRAPPTP